ncbi:Clathrin Heavy Chain 1 [Manis pentadactyla]|nr:Clathrin Heavy Chain 1 [Manis pentadactyla]
MDSFQAQLLGADEQTHCSVTSKTRRPVGRLPSSLLLQRGRFQCLPCKAGERAQTVSQRMPTAQKRAVSRVILVTHRLCSPASFARVRKLALGSLPCRIPPDLC